MGCSLVFTRSIQKDINGELERILKANFTTPYTLDYADIMYLKGLADAGITGTDVLIKAIHDYGEITLELRC